MGSSGGQRRPRRPALAAAVQSVLADMRKQVPSLSDGAAVMGTDLNDLVMANPPRGAWVKGDPNCRPLNA